MLARKDSRFWTIAQAEQQVHKGDVRVYKQAAWTGKVAASCLGSFPNPFTYQKQVLTIRHSFILLVTGRVPIELLRLLSGAFEAKLSFNSS